MHIRARRIARGTHRQLASQSKTSSRAEHVGLRGITRMGRGWESGGAPDTHQVPRESHERWIFRVALTFNLRTLAASRCVCARARVGVLFWKRPYRCVVPVAAAREKVLHFGKVKTRRMPRNHFGYFIANNMLFVIASQSTKDVSVNFFIVFV